MHDLIIVGGGPAAYAAAFFLRSKGQHPLMIYEEHGGKTALRFNQISFEEVEEVPGHDLLAVLFQGPLAPHDVVHDVVRLVTRTNAHFVLDTAHHGSFETRTVIIATGVRPILLQVPGADSLLGQGLGYSLTAHAASIAGHHIAVVGTTPRMLRGIAEILPAVASITLISHQPRLPDTPLMDQLRLHPKLTIYIGAEVVAITGGSVVRSVVIRQGTVQLTVATDRVFADLGVVPCSQCVRDLIVCDPEGFMVIDEYHMSTAAGLFAAGDVTTSAFGENHLLAVAEGLRAGASAYEYLLAAQVVDAVERTRFHGAPGT